MWIWLLFQSYHAMMEYMLAAENRRSKIGVQYYWRIFDVEKKGRLTLSTLNLFLRDINAKMASLRLEVMPIENMTVRSSRHDFPVVKI
jgi:hypothetical protein